jgi:hypothetical protein
MKRQTDLLETALALRTRSGFPNESSGGQDQAHDHGDEGDHH